MAQLFGSTDNQKRAIPVGEFKSPWELAKEHNKQKKKVNCRKAVDASYFIGC